MSIDFREPRPLARRVMISTEVGDDASDECFELAVPAEFGGVLLAVCHHDPTKITGPIRLPDDDGILFRFEHLTLLLNVTDTTVSVTDYRGPWVTLLFQAE